MRLHLSLAATVAAIVLFLGTLVGSAGAQDNIIVGHGQAVAQIKGALIAIANDTTLYLVDARTGQSIHKIDYGLSIFDLSHGGQFLAVTLETGLVLIEDIGIDGEHAGNPKTTGKVQGTFVRATLAGDILIAIDKDGTVFYIMWREGDRPTEPCPFKGGCPEGQRIYLPVTAKLVTGDGRWACGSGGPGDPCATPPPAGPTTDPGEVPPTPRHGPTPTRAAPTARVPEPTPGGCAYPPCSQAEADKVFGHSR